MSDEEQQFLDCDKLATEKAEVLLTGQDLMAITNGIGMFRELPERMPEVRTCEDCYNNLKILDIKIGMALSEAVLKIEGNGE